MRQAGIAGPSGQALSVRLLGGFELIDHSSAIDLPTDAQRLVAFLALQHRRLPRTYVAGRLWIESSADRAYGNLRSALWRVRNQSADLVVADRQTLAIATDAEIDTELATATAARLSDNRGECSEEDFDVGLFTDELLPGWYDEWTIVEREFHRQQSLHALESMAAKLSDQGRYVAAIHAALAAIELDPLRESAHRCLMRIHLSEGNYSEARRQFDSYARLLDEELGLGPSPLIRALVP